MFNNLTAEIRRLTRAADLAGPVRRAELVRELEQASARLERAKDNLARLAAGGWTALAPAGQP